MIPTDAKELESLFETNPWWQKLLKEAERVHYVKNLPPEVTDRVMIGTVDNLWESIEILEDNFTEAEKDSVYLGAREILSQLKQGDKFPERVFELYRGQIPKALNKIDDYAKALIDLIQDSDLQKEVNAKWKEGKKIPFQKLKDEFKIESLEQRYLLRKLSELLEKRNLTKEFYYPFGEEDLFEAKPVGINRDRFEYLSYRVYDPLWISGLEDFEIEYINFPLGWAGLLFTVTQMKGLYDYHKSGKDVLAQLNTYFQEDNILDEIENAIASCPITARHGDLFKETIVGYRKGLYKISSRTMLSLIEGIIWDFAWWWNRKSGSIIDKSIKLEDFRKLKFRLLKPDGQEINAREPTIGLLLRNTKFGEEFYFEFVEYYCEELFRERNPALHGRNPNFKGFFFVTVFKDS